MKIIILANCMGCHKLPYYQRARVKEKNHFFRGGAYEKRSTEQKFCLSYDLNGNIQSLTRYDKNGIMDQLSYDYTNSGNQLQSVADTAPAASKDGGFKDGNDHVATGLQDYDYDDNGNMVVDLNKGIANIEYNHMNLPNKVTKDDGQYIKYIYDAAGIKLAQELYDANDVRQKRTDYIGAFIYETEGSNPSELAIIQHEEGRIVPNAVTGNFEYQYHLKDHLGNTRVTFTTEPKTHEFNAFYEDATTVTKDGEEISNDMGSFEAMGNIFSMDVHDVTDAGSTYTKAQKLTGADGSIVGSILTIPVGKGDIIDATVSAKYLAATGTANGASTVAGSLIGALTGSSTTANFEGAANTTTASHGGSFVSTLGDGVNSSEPMAFINLMFLAEDATDVTSDRFSYGQITGSSSNAHHEMSLPEAYEAPSNGYVVVYLSNDSDFLTEVYFDDLKVTVNESKIIQTDDYYPFGMQTAKSWTRQGNENKYLYNAGNELNEESGLYETFYREYDAALGRMMQVDPMVDKYASLTPYNYAFNEPVLKNDPMGDDTGGRYAYASYNGRFDGGAAKKFGNGNGYQDYHAGTGAMYGGSYEDAMYGRMGSAGANHQTRLDANLMSEEDYIAKYGETQTLDNVVDFYTNGDKERFIITEYNFKANKVAQNGGGDPKDPNALNPSTLYGNWFFGKMHYPGPNNPKKNSGRPDYSTPPVTLAGYPAIGHDRRYDNLEVAGAKGLFTDTRAIGADWKFVSEEFQMGNLAWQLGDVSTSLKAIGLGTVLGIAALPKTIFQYASSPNFGHSQVMIWYTISNQGVSNKPSK